MVNGIIKASLYVLRNDEPNINGNDLLYSVVYNNEVIFSSVSNQESERR